MTEQEEPSWWPNLSRSDFSAQIAERFKLNKADPPTKAERMHGVAAWDAMRKERMERMGGDAIRGTKAGEKAKQQSWNKGMTVKVKGA